MIMNFAVSLGWLTNCNNEEIMARVSKEDEDPLVRVKQYVESHNIKVSFKAAYCAK